MHTARNSEIDAAFLNRLGAGHLPGHLGMVVARVEDGAVELELEVHRGLLAPNGRLHAGTLASLADTAAGYACIAHLPPGAESFATVELKLNLLGTVDQGAVRCAARALHLGRTTQVWDATVSDAAGRPLAVFRCTQLILYPKPAAKPAMPA